MAKQRYVNTFFWDDPYIEELCPEGKLLFIYLITTPLTNIAGSFEITIKKIHDHTGLDRTVILDLLKRFEADGKAVYREGWMLMVNAIEHQNWRTHKTIRLGIESVVNGSPDWIKDRLCIAYGWLSHLNLNSNLNLNLDLRGGVPPAAAAAMDPSPETDKAPEADAVGRRIWIDGKELLARSGMKPGAAGSLLGRWAKDHGRVSLATAIAACQAVNTPDPKAYIGGILRESVRIKAALDVGKSEFVQPDVACTECFDMGTVSVKDDTAEWDWVSKSVPCPSCGAKDASE